MEKSPDAFRTITEVAEVLETPAHVLRFWESRFPQIRPVKRAGGRRYYRPADVALLTGIKRLLHDEGMTIRGVQKILREQGVRHVSGLAEDVPDDVLDDAGVIDAEAGFEDAELPVSDTVIALDTRRAPPPRPIPDAPEPAASPVQPDFWALPPEADPTPAAADAPPLPADAGGAEPVAAEPVAAEPVAAEPDAAAPLPAEAVTAEGSSTERATPVAASAAAAVAEPPAALPEAAPPAPAPTAPAPTAPAPTAAAPARDSAPAGPTLAARLRAMSPETMQARRAALLPVIARLDALRSAMAEAAQRARR